MFQSVFLVPALDMTGRAQLNDPDSISALRSVTESVSDDNLSCVRVAVQLNEILRCSQISMLEQPLDYVANTGRLQLLPQRYGPFSLPSNGGCKDLQLLFLPFAGSSCLHRFLALAGDRQRAIVVKGDNRAVHEDIHGLLGELCTAQGGVRESRYCAVFKTHRGDEVVRSRVVACARGHGQSLHRFHR